MRIYISHSTSFDYTNELYKPLRKSILNTEHEITLPHEKSEELFNSKKYFDNCDLVIAEISYPSTGLGIELGWANIKNIPIICLYKKGSNPSRSAKAVSDHLLEYSDSNDLIKKIKDYL